MVDEEMTEDMEMADEMLSGAEFILDVQTHTAMPIEEPWDDGPPDERALDYISQIFVQSETDVAVLSGAPNTRALGAPNIASRDQMREIIDRIGGPRLLIHANTEPERGATLVLVTHSDRLAASCDRRLLLVDGTLVEAT
jgi:hypothetical protein